MSRTSRKYMPSINRKVNYKTGESGWEYLNLNHTCDIGLRDASIRFSVDGVDVVFITEEGIIDIIGSGTGVLPSQTGHTGEYLKSNGTVANWSSISHTELEDIGTNTHAQVDTHIADSTIHFTEASIDHTGILNIGTNTHAQIDTHIADEENPHSVTKTQIGLSNVTNVDCTNADNIASGTLSENRLPTTSVTPGSYTITDLTVDATGRITAASNGALFSIVRKASESLNAGSNSISFSSEVGSTSYIFVGIPYCYDSSGNTIIPGISNRTVSGFTAYVAVDCTCEYKIEML